MILEVRDLVTAYGLGAVIHGISFEVEAGEVVCLRGNHHGLIGIVVLIVDFTDDFFQHVFNGNQAGNATMFIDYNGHVVARLPEFFE